MRRIARICTRTVTTLISSSSLSTCECILRPSPSVLSYSASRLRFPLCNPTARNYSSHTLASSSAFRLNPNPSSSSSSSPSPPSSYSVPHWSQISLKEQLLSSSDPTPSIPTLKSGEEWDVIIVGGGHNGLTSAAYLSKYQGLKVLLLERRYILGGAAITEEINPGFHYSRASYLFSLFRPSIIEELELKSRHGLKYLYRDPSSFTPLLEGRYLLMGRDTNFNTQQIEKFSKRDAKLYPEYDAHLTRLTTFFAPYLDAPPPSFYAYNWRERKDQLKVLKTLMSNAMKLGRECLDFHEILTAPASRILNRWFESEPLKSTLATDAVIGAMCAPSTPGSGYVLFHHVMGELDGSKGAWAYVVGGMGAVSQSLASAARAAGASLHTNAKVSRILIDKGRTQGVLLENGQEIRSKIVISNATPHITFLRLISSSDLPSSYRRHIEHLDTTSPVCKINVSLDTLPNFICAPNNNNLNGTPTPTPGPQHRGTIHFVENCEQIEESYRDALSGIPSRRPIIEMTIPSALDPTIAPPGKHVANLFVQYAPYNIKGGWSRGMREDFAKTCFGLIDEYAPGFSSSILHYEILTPQDLERVFGLTGGNIFHHSMSLDQLFWLRPMRDYSTHRTPIEGLYLCGAGTHPGGGVMGSSGKNCAKIVGYEFKEKFAKKK